MEEFSFVSRFLFFLLPPHFIFPYSFKAKSKALYSTKKKFVLIKTKNPRKETPQQASEKECEKKIEKQTRKIAKLKEKSAMERK